MATTKPRITVTLTNRQYEVLKSISNSGGTPMSTLLGELIEASLPTLERMANTFQRLKQAQTIERAKMIEALDDAHAALEPIASSAIDQFDLFLGRIEEATAGAPHGNGETRAATAGAALTPLTNRGATTTKQKTRKPTAAKVSSTSKKTVFLKKSGE